MNLGLFGYDISCMVEMCAIALDFNSECALIQARGIDGLAIGVHGSIDNVGTHTRFFCFGFRDSEQGDKAVCMKKSGLLVTLWWYQNY